VAVAMPTAHKNLTERNRSETLDTFIGLSCLTSPPR
jgi:hypothetical protein